MRLAATWLALAIAAATTSVLAQAPAPGSTFDVVSIKRHVPPSGVQVFNATRSRPDGGFTTTNALVTSLISRAYPYSFIDGLPEWARSERYDVSAISTLPQATADSRVAMMRAMLADRFKLVVHFEKRSQEVYDLLPARSDGRLGSGLTPLDKDCAPLIAAQRDAFEARGAPMSPPDLNAPPPPCTLRSVRGRNDPADRMEGETTMENLSQTLRMSAGRMVIDRTGLTGSYRVNMTYDLLGSRRPPEVSPPPDAAPTVFTAIREQLGLKLESSKAQLDTLIIDRLERPTEN